MGIRSKIGLAFAGANPRVCIAFWIFGLINNILYVIILSAALDLVGPTLPKAIVLLADVMPSFLTKLFLPYVIQTIPYSTRVLLMAGLAFVGMQIVAQSSSITMRLFGVVLASISSGMGELSFLGLTHYYGRFALAFWGSGTGAAGLAGAGMYAIVTTGWEWKVKNALMVFGILPIVMVTAYFGLLPRGSKSGYERVGDEEESEELPAPTLERDLAPKATVDLQQIKAMLARAKHLFFPYMLPLLLVYIAEYTINQGVAPTLLWHVDEMPFQNYRDAYVSYNTVYQLGVFVSRSSTPFYRIHRLYPPSLLQCLNLFLLIAQSLYSYLPNIYVVWLVIFWEGLLGGAVYVNTFAEIQDNVPLDEREFSLEVTTVSDSGGICIAGFISLALEPWLCGKQVAMGKEWCRLS